MCVGEGCVCRKLKQRGSGGGVSPAPLPSHLFGRCEMTSTLSFFNVLLRSLQQPELILRLAVGHSRCLLPDAALPAPLEDAPASATFHHLKGINMGIGHKVSK